MSKYLFDKLKNIIKLWKTGRYKIIKTRDKHEAKMLKLDISKTQHYLKWMPVYDSMTAVRETVDWYKRFYMVKQEMYSYTIKQLKKYIATAKKTNINMFTYSCFRI